MGSAIGRSNASQRLKTHKMKILHVITSLFTGGAENLITQIVPMMISDGHQVEVALFNGTDTPFKRQLQQAGVKIHSFSNGGSVYNPLNIFRLRRLMRGFDIVHTHNTAPQLFAAIASVLCSVVLCTTEHNTSNRRRGWKWYARIDRWMYGRYRHVICISPATKDNLRQFLGQTPTATSMIYNGIDVKRFNEAKATDIGKEEFGCRVALMQVAGFRYQKDQDTVIRALTLLPDDIHLFLVGGGERENELKALASSLGVMQRVHFMGIRPDVPQLLKAADIIVMSSHWEGFGLAAVEGMAAGRPVIASDIQGLGDVVRGAGILIQPRNHTALADEIMKLDADSALYASVAEKCAQRANDYDLAKMVHAYENVYNQIAAN